MFHLLSRFLALVSSINATVVDSRKEWTKKSFRSLTTFGDSYTDESRLAYFASNRGTAPPQGWAEPLNSHTSTRGCVWPRYLSWCSGLNVYNIRSYLLSGCLCSKESLARSEWCRLPKCRYATDHSAWRRHSAISRCPELPAGCVLNR
ncbi:uncharacterized protein PV09_03294 [Verruconis gallopava]|uniref:SGNH hydrolase-type esterase domain-containing protein n=1 Tax=Verruconis gallopava TaxID=253628 RepID=A0A0D2B4H4_9PEZI|nr:uncharacterized protein PV09_03294 [Verruconis gallopava]KIW06129.1 hypothetical protein PV09_03294 [Verruconis gallopava]